MNTIEVEASCVDEVGGGDGAYNLIGVFEPEEFCRELLQTLNTEWGLSHATGEVSLQITIRRKKDPATN